MGSMKKADAAQAGRELATENDTLRRELHKRDQEIERLAYDLSNARAAKDKLRKGNEELRAELDRCRGDLRDARADVDKLRKSV